MSGFSGHGGFDSGTDGNGETVAAGATQNVEAWLLDAANAENIAGIVTIGGGSLRFAKSCLADVWLSIGLDAAPKSGEVKVTAHIDGPGIPFGQLGADVAVGKANAQGEHVRLLVPEGATITVSVSNTDDADAQVYVNANVTAIAV